jgi:peptidoglycan hydrolase CwlO-like protein
MIKIKIMLSFVLASAFFLPTFLPYDNNLEIPLTVQASTANTSIEGRVINTEDTFKIGKFLENNWVVILGFVVFLIRLQNSVEDIKKDNQNKIELLTKDFELIKSGLSELRQQIDHTAGNAKEDVEKVAVKLKGTQRTLYKLIEFINSDRSINSKPIFKVSKYDDEDGDV